MSFVALLYALFASVFTVSKQALMSAEPIFLVGARMTVAGILMLLFQRISNKSSLVLSRKVWGKIVLLAFFNIYLTNVLEFVGLSKLPAFKTCFIYSLSPFISALFSFFFWKERLSSKKWFGLLLGFSGLVPVFIHLSQGDSSGNIFSLSWPELSVAFAAATGVYGWIILRSLMFDDNLPPLVANGLSMLIGGSFALLHSSFCEAWDPIPVHNYIPFLLCTLFLIVVSNCICYNLYGYLLKKFTATFMSFAGLTTPLFTALFGWIIHNEIPNSGFWLSFIVVVGGLTIFYQAEIQAGDFPAFKGLTNTFGLFKNRIFGKKITMSKEG